MGANTINAAIVGCGFIGTQGDQPDNDKPYSLTHAAAIARNPAARLAAVCDQDLGKAQSAAARWACPNAYSDVADMLAETPVDLAVVATSSAERLSVIEPLLAAGIKYFVIEKPLAATLAEGKKLLALLDAAGARAVVNFSRRWDPSMQALRGKIAGGEWGALQRLVALYGKGIANNGSHMIDLAGYLCNARPLKARSLGSPKNAWPYGDDPTLDAQIIFAAENGSTFQLDLLGTDAAAFTCFEMKIIGHNALCDITRGGRAISIKTLAPDPDFPAYTIPGPATSMPARAMEAMDNMTYEAVLLAQGGISQPRCDAHAALATVAAVEAIRQSAASDGAWIAVS